MITSAHCAALGILATLSPAACTFSRDLLVSASPDLHVYSGVFQVQRMRMSLGTVADYGYLFAENQIQIGIIVVINFRHLLPSKEILICEFEL